MQVLPSSFNVHHDYYDNIEVFWGSVRQMRNVVPEAATNAPQNWSLSCKSSLPSVGVRNTYLWYLLA